MIVRLHGQKLDLALTVGRPVKLPASGGYTIAVDPIGYEDDPYGSYAFTLSIH